MLNLVWSDDAHLHLESILDFIAYDSPNAAAPLKTRIDQSILTALQYPDGFRPGRLAGTREILAHPNYVVVYRLSADVPKVLAVLHSRQHYP